MSLLALLAATRTTVPDPIEPDPAGPAWRNVASQTRPQYGIANTVAETRTDTVTLTIQADVDQITLVYGVGAGNVGVTTVGNPVTYTATVNGTPVTWGGAESGLCPDGKSIESDPLDTTLKAGDTITVTSTGTAPGGRVPRSPDGKLTPAQVRGYADRPSMLILGSSSGQPDAFGQGFADAGLPVINGACGGSRASNFNATAFDVTGIVGDHGITHAFLQVGINSNSQGVKAMCQGNIDLAWRCRDRGIPNVTAMVWKPHTTSTDGWTTVEGQAPRYAARAQAVAWLRRGAPVTADGRTYDLNGITTGALYAGQPGHPFTDVCDWSSLIQDATNPDAFRVDHGAITTDGLHINATGYELGKPVLYEWARSVMNAWVPAE